jgi:hypothetical protein
LSQAAVGHAEPCPNRGTVVDADAGQYFGPTNVSIRWRHAQCLEWLFTIVQPACRRLPIEDAGMTTATGAAAASMRPGRGSPQAIVKHSPPVVCDAPVAEVEAE